MAESTKIEWTDATWNPITGCKIVSPGCTNCYAMKLAGTRLRNHRSRSGLTIDTKAGAIWNGELRFNEEWLDQPIRWRKPRRIFVCAHGDLFADGVEDAWLDKIFAVMACSRQHIFQVLTKRPQRMHDYLTTKMLNHRLAATTVAFDFDVPDDLHFPNLPLPHVWLGVSVEDQARADERIPHLLATPAAVRWISAEPLLGQLDLNAYLYIYTRSDMHLMEETPQELLPVLPYNAPLTTPIEDVHTPRLDWVVVGGESGPGARPMHPDWARATRDQCQDAEVPFFFKQWGNWQIASEANGHIDHNMDRNDAIWIDIDGTRQKPSSIGLKQACAMNRVPKAVAGRLLDGIEHSAAPEFHHD